MSVVLQLPCLGLVQLLTPKQVAVNNNNFNTLVSKGDIKA